MSREELLASISPGDSDETLVRQVNFEQLPAHIAVIMDGNGRWAAQRHLPRVEGHRAGIDAVRDTVETAARLGIKVLTLYAFSAENWKRPAAEVSTLMLLLKRYLRAELNTLVGNNIRFEVIGRLEELASDVQDELNLVIERTAQNPGMLFNLALNYSGRAEIVDAARRAIESGVRPADLDEQLFARFLYTAGQPDPDLLIRTSGEMRVSNYLLWQIAYAEIYVTETLWPDFRRRHLLEAVLAYQKRERRYGGINILTGGDRREMTRVISGVALAAAALAAILFLPVVALRGVACTVAALAAHEYVRVADGAGGVSRWLLVVAVVAACWVASTGFGVDLLVVFLVALAWVGAEVLFLGRTIQQAGVAMIAPLYIGVPLGMLAGIQMLGGWPATVLLIATIVVSDSAQYYSGRQFGRRPLAPTISPKKTVEGAIGGVALGTVFMLLVGGRVFPTAPSWALVWLGAVVVLLGICGDLFESRLKRAAGLKDSSALIPGHGGVLDRIDALLFATPAFYTYVRIVT